jgi:hypothetical protein
MKVFKIILFVHLFFQLFGQTCTTISDGTYGNSQTTPLSPMYGLYNYSWSSNLYNAADIGGAKTIGSIAWYVDSYQSGYSQTGPYTFNNVQIYFAYTTLSGWGNTNNVSGLNRLTGVNVAQGITSWTKVFDGNITFNTCDAYKTITLTTPFSYDGVTNLVVHVDNNDGSYVSGYPNFHYTNYNTSTSTRTMKYGAQDASMGPTSGTRLYARADIRFCTVAALPVVLNSFDVYDKKIGNELFWETSYEYNTSHFTIEKSIDGTSWNVVSQINSAGFSDNLNSYRTYDYNVENTINYYRLIQHDLDGKFEIYGPISINNSDLRLKTIVKYINEIGQEIDPKTNEVFFEVYEDGSIIKRFGNGN